MESADKEKGRCIQMERRKCGRTDYYRGGNHRYGIRIKRKCKRYGAAGIVLCMIGIVLFIFLSAWQMFVDVFAGGSLEQQYSTYAGGGLRNLHSSYAILTELDSGNTLAESRSAEKMYPASLTKIMTALLAVEYTEDLDEMMTVPEELFPELYSKDASMAGFQPGEVAYCRDVLYGILLPSGAECCKAYAEYIAGSEDAFVELMNEKAEELGMKHTHFCNSTGLHERGHYSTAEDMAVLLRYALSNEAFREAFTSSFYSVPPSRQHPEGFTFYSTLSPFIEQAQIMDGEILGGKTGYTKEAGLCLASLARVEGKEYILVTAKANGSHETEPFHVMDAVKVYNSLGSK